MPVSIADLQPEKGQARLQAMDLHLDPARRLPIRLRQTKSARQSGFSAHQVPLDAVIAIAEFACQEAVCTSRNTAKSRPPIPCVPTTMPSRSTANSSLQSEGFQDPQVDQ
jgi:hypothetical protein